MYQLRWGVRACSVGSVLWWSRSATPIPPVFHQHTVLDRKTGSGGPDPSKNPLVYGLLLASAYVQGHLIYFHRTSAPRELSQFWYNPDQRYTGCKISVSLTYVTGRGKVRWKGQGGELNALCAIASPSSPYLGWLATCVRFCNSQRSSEISCDKFQGKVVAGAY
jgi:hypothetical protein